MSRPLTRTYLKQIGLKLEEVKTYEEEEAEATLKARIDARAVVRAERRAHTVAVADAGLAVAGVAVAGVASEARVMTRAALRSQITAGRTGRTGGSKFSSCGKLAEPTP
jgi:hypothetical protein